MAKKVSGAAAPETVDPAGTYQIKMGASVRHGATWLRPNSGRIRVSGAALLELGDAVAEFQRIE